MGGHRRQSSIAYKASRITGRLATPYFQKLVYFASRTGIATALEFERKSYGPFARALKIHIARLQNNGLAVEQ